MKKNLRLRPVVGGLLSLIPSYWSIKKAGKAAGNARYLYSVWLRHLSAAYENGMTTVPNVIAELGPGSSIGFGLAGLLSGASKYYALDVVDLASCHDNVRIFDDLVRLFKNREAIPGETEFPYVGPNLKSYDFPHYILSEAHLDSCLKHKRIQAIRHAISNWNDRLKNSEILIKYFVPWYNINVMKKESVDFIFSQAVLEHIEDLENTYKAFYSWLKPGGYMSHQIDFSCHGIANHWNGHWEYSDIMFNIIKGKRKYFLNRAPHSFHLNLAEKYGLKIISDIYVKDVTGIKKDNFSRKHRQFNEDDFFIREAHILSKKI